MSFEGSLQDRQLGEVLLALGREDRTGILTIQGEHEIIAVSLLEGAVVSADALNQTLEDGLGRVLSTLGLVTPDRFAELAAEQQAGGGQVTELLIERAYLDDKQLWEALRIHTYRLCLQALSWNHGEYKFYGGDEVSHEPGMTPIGVEELLVRASRDLGGGGGLLAGSLPDATSVYARVPEAFDEEGTRDGEDPLLALAADDLGAEAGRIFSLVNGHRSVAELAASSGASEYKVVFCLHRWSRAGLVTPADGEAAPAVEAPAPAPAAVVAEEPVREEPPPPRRAREKRPPRRPRTPPGIQPWPARLLGLVLVALFTGLVFLQPGRVLLPYPWQDALRAGLAKDRRAVSVIEIERTASVFFLLRGRYPGELVQLVEAGLLGPRDLDAAGGGGFQYSATEASFLLEARDAAGESEIAYTGSIAGNFLLDPDFVVERPTDVAPLVLLD